MLKFVITFCTFNSEEGPFHLSDNHRKTGIFQICQISLPLFCAAGEAVSQAGLELSCLPPELPTELCVSCSSMCTSFHSCLCYCSIQFLCFFFFKLISCFISMCRNTETHMYDPSTNSAQLQQSSK